MSSNRHVVDAEEILDGILSWVQMESPTHETAAVNALVDLVETDLRVHGANVERLPGRDGYGDILLARSPWGGDGPGILFLGHLDTVHPIGTKAEVNPIRREDDKVYGPGIYDMKAGSYLGYYAYHHLARQGLQTPLPITLLLVPEEEVGSPISREVIEAEAAKAKYVLVAEPARDGGRIVTARKGVARFDMEITGRPAHSGSRHQDGRSAIREMAQQILALEAMTDYETGVTVNVGVVDGGTAVNVVPFASRAEIDMRVPDEVTAEEMCARILGLQAVGEDVEVKVTGGLNRPPFEKGEGIADLFAHARKLAAEIGFELNDTYTGGAHTHWEHILVSSLEERAKLMIRLMETLD